jgi:hypothetical protein
MPRPRPLTRPPSRRPRRRVPGASGARAGRALRGVRLALAGLLVASALAACGGAPVAAPDAWTEADLAGVFDLTELGSDLAMAAGGDHLTLDGRALPPALLARMPHLSMGRSLNLLRLSDDALSAMAPDVAAALVRAAPGELRAHLARYGLAVGDVRAAWGAGGELDLAALRSVAARLDGDGVRAAGVGAGSRLLADLGVAR